MTTSRKSSNPAIRNFSMNHIVVPTESALLSITNSTRLQATSSVKGRWGADLFGITGKAPSAVTMKSFTKGRHVSSAGRYAVESGRSIHRIPSTLAFPASNNNVEKTAASSSMAKSIEEQLKLFGPIKGHILSLSYFHYIYFLIVIGLARNTGWVPNIRPYNILIYFNVFCLTMEFTRFLHVINPESLWPLYLSLINFATIINISREAHMIVALLWYVSVMIIHLQSGNSKLQKHLRIFSAIYVGIYVISLIFMTRFYIDPWPIIVPGLNCDEICGDILSTAINPLRELVFLLGFLIICFSYLMLERFIKAFVMILLDRELYLKNLYTTNLELKKEIRRAKTSESNELDLETPISKVRQILLAIKDEASTEQSVKDSLDFVLHILSTGVNHLFTPELDKENKVDDELHEWLSTILLSGGNETSQNASRRSYQKSMKSITTPPNNPNENESPRTARPRKQSGLSENLNLGKNLKLKSAVLNMDSSRKLSTTEDPFSKQKVNLLGTPGIVVSIPSLSIEQLESNVIPIPKEILDNEAQIFNQLLTIDKWDYDIFELNELTKGHPLYYITLAIFKSHGFNVHLDISEAKLLKFIQLIESNYWKKNPYHNSLHAADVTQGINFFLTTAKLKDAFTLEEKCAAIVSGIVHDFQHPGVNNSFLATTRDPMAIRYNDRSILENFHASATFEILKHSEYDIFENLPVERRKKIRDIIISNVLATDMAEHFEILGMFKNKMETNKFDLVNYKDKQLVLNMAIKAADIGNPAKCWQISRKWTDLVVEEFFRQGDREKSLGIPISGFMNRLTTDTPKTQMSFIGYFVVPLVEAWVNLFQGEIKLLYENVHQNQLNWKKLADPPSSNIMSSTLVAENKRIS